MPAARGLPSRHGPRRAGPRPVLPALPVGHAYLCTDPGGLTLIDTSFPGSAAHIGAAIRQAGHHPAKLRQIVLTHFHADHAGRRRVRRLVPRPGHGLPRRRAVPARRRTGSGTTGRLRTPLAQSQLVSLLSGQAAPENSSQPRYWTRLLWSGGRPWPERWQVAYASVAEPDAVVSVAAQATSSGRTGPSRPRHPH
jgi:Metallo-beta-lactamase superfamily